MCFVTIALIQVIQNKGIQLHDVINREHCVKMANNPLWPWRRVPRTPMATSYPLPRGAEVPHFLVHMVNVSCFQPSVLDNKAEYLLRLEEGKALGHDLWIGKEG